MLFVIVCCVRFDVCFVVFCVLCVRCGVLRVACCVLCVVQCLWVIVYLPVWGIYCVLFVVCSVPCVVV